MKNVFRATLVVAFLFLLQACTHTNLRQALQKGGMQRNATKNLAVYEPWFGKPDHISVGYSTQDPEVIRKQIDEAKGLDISGFVVDWYGDRQKFENTSYALIQAIAAEKNFLVAMMYDETEDDNGQVTEDTLSAFDQFHETYLAANARGRSAYLEYQGRPVIFIFPKSAKTDWHRVRQATSQWERPPLLIYEYRQTAHADDFDGFYAWINPGKKGWAADGSNWGEDYLRDFYTQMQSKYPQKLAVGAAWAGFNDSKASWGLGRHMSERCGQTMADTMSMNRQYQTDNSEPFLLIATWNDYEEGSAIERGLEKCSPQAVASAR